MIKFYSFIGIITMSFLNLSYADLSEEDEFENAWKNPNYTQIELTDLDINKVLKNYYITEPNLKMTRTMLWDLEQKKAWSPQVYISDFAKDGKSWGKSKINEYEKFVRMTKQRQWLDMSTYGDIFEKVSIDHKNQKVTFIGIDHLIDEFGVNLKANNSQALFHVEHSLKGSEDQPINTWRIVHLTFFKDKNLLSVFRSREDLSVLPIYILKYIKLDLDVKLIKK